MVEVVSCEIWQGGEGLAGALRRYELIDRLARSARRQDVALLAFGIGKCDLRLVVEGAPEAVGQVLRGVKVGTRRAVHQNGIELRWSPNERAPLPAGGLEAAVAWAHRAPVVSGLPDPLASPWSTHRDLLGYRRAPFYDRRLLDGRVDPRAVHRLAGGRELPAGWPPAHARVEPLELLLRIAAGVTGVLPADTRCFRLFVNLARARGWRTAQIAPILAVTDRRIRQLGQAEDTRLPAALRCLADDRLCRVP